MQRADRCFQNGLLAVQATWSSSSGYCCFQTRLSCSAVTDCAKSSSSAAAAQVAAAAMDMEVLVARSINRIRALHRSVLVVALRRFIREETLAFRQMLGSVIRWVVDTLDDLLQYRFFLLVVRFCLNLCTPERVPASPP